MIGLEVGFAVDKVEIVGSRVGSDGGFSGLLNEYGAVVVPVNLSSWGSVHPTKREKTVRSRRRIDDVMEGDWDRFVIDFRR